MGAVQLDCMNTNRTKLTREKSIKMDSNSSITIRPITASVAENPHVREFALLRPTNTRAADKRVSKVPCATRYNETYMTAVKRIQLIWKIENLSDLRFIKIYFRRIDVYDPTTIQL
jgi:hypothetical protein